MANPFPFVAGSILEAAQLNGIGETTSFTPVFTNLTVGNGTVTAYYTRIQKLVKVYVNVLFGSTTSITGALTMDLPITAKSDVLRQLTLARLFDATDSASFGVCDINAATTVTVTVISAGSTYARPAALSSTVPFTWTTSDSITLNLIYEAA